MRTDGEDVLAEIMGSTWGPNGSFVPFREYNIPSRDFGKGNSATMDAATLRLAQARGCAAAIEDHALEARRGAGTIICNNDGAPGPVNGSAGFGPGPYGNITYLGQHKISLAAFMMGMEKGSYCPLAIPFSWIYLVAYRGLLSVRSRERAALDGQRLALYVR